jgi:hypothetical protein
VSSGIITGESAWEASPVQAGVQVARVECAAVTLRPPDPRCAPILRTQLIPDADVYCRRQDPRPSATRPSARAHHRRLLKGGGRGSRALRRAPSSRPSRRGFGSPSCPHRRSRTCCAGREFRPCRDFHAEQLPPVRAVPADEAFVGSPLSPHAAYSPSVTSRGSSQHPATLISGRLSIDEPCKSDISGPVKPWVTEDCPWLVEND